MATTQHLSNRRWLPLAALFSAAAAAALLLAAAHAPQDDDERTAPTWLDSQARVAVVGVGWQRLGAIHALRAQGYAGLAALERAWPQALAELRADVSHPAPAFSEEAEAVREAYGQVAGQRDAHASRLFWHDDLASALRDARASGRPVLSLRMLGRLDEELSCANSRLFRVLLYADPEVAALLQERFVLHGSSERPVPRVTIDMGDGRVIEETITGNSIHYVLDANGRVIDAMPGLVEPTTFRTWLSDALGANLLAGTTALDRASWLRLHHARQLSDLDRQFEARFGEPLPRFDVAVPVDEQGVRLAPSAARAVPIAVSKSSIELPRLKALPAGWRERMAALDDDKRTLLASRIPVTEPVGASRTLALRKLDPAESQPAAVFWRLRRDVALDTLVNQYELRPAILEWLAEGDLDLDALNRRVYDELFLTPRGDPWLGLRGQRVFTALDGDGIRTGR